MVFTNTPGYSITIGSFAKDYGSKSMNLYPKTPYTTDSAATKKDHLN